jgi:hypothetical protein
VKYSEITKLQSAPRLLRKEAAEAYVGAPQLLVKLVRAGWLKPTVQRNRLTLYDQRRLDDCVERLNGGEFPGERAA